LLLDTRTLLWFLVHHKDPFDRLIAATVLVEGLTLLSVDAAFDTYGLTRLW
jgi:PIN domain nuclease of toxin-antitoxin system